MSGTRFFQLVSIGLFVFLLSCYKVHETVYLTFPTPDTSTTITVNYLTKLSSEKSHIYYDTQSRGGKRDDYPFHTSTNAFSALKNENTFHHVNLSGLQPNTIYYFIYGDSRNGYSKELKFRTLPNDGSTVRIAQGGDIGSDEPAEIISNLIAEQSPHAVLIGGDIAYANGDFDVGGPRWNKWFRNVSEKLVTDNGLIIPMILAIGNHESNKKPLPASLRAPFFTNFFKQDDEHGTYFVRELGSDGVLFVLDSGHIATWSTQVPWLTKMLEKYKDRPIKMAMYHIPLYPSHRNYNGAQNAVARSLWIPVFEKYGLDIAFENHDHMHKRTYLMRDSMPVESKGVLYLGDGSWGRSPRFVNEENIWYLKKVTSNNHFWLADLESGVADIKAIDSDGKLFDHFRYENGLVIEMLDYSKAFFKDFN